MYRIKPLERFDHENKDDVTFYLLQFVQGDSFTMVNRDFTLYSLINDEFGDTVATFQSIV